ncbi:MAG: mechanosensitive ion channel family protein [Lentisphaeria bacterium]|nr:mechanosensitive ion channel family protein [Lentisphaeria bacterium]
MPQPTQTEAVVDNVITIVKSGEARNFLQNLWADHQGEIIRFGKILLLTIVVLVLAWVISRMLRTVIRKSAGKIATLDDSAAKVIHGVVRTVIWLFAFLIVLDLFGINTASILTVLGAVGLTVGLAVKDSLSNIAAGLMLFFLRPYKVGDYVDCGTVSGTIKEMGLFSTVLMTVDGVFISAPNSVIFGNPVKNYSRNPMRRADITVGIAYGDSLAQGVEILRELLMQNELIARDPAPEVLVSELADSSVNLTLRFWVSTENFWKVFWSVKQDLKSTIESAGLNIPFPQRVVTFATPLVLQDREK